MKRLASFSYKTITEVIIYDTGEVEKQEWNFKKNKLVGGCSTPYGKFTQEELKNMGLVEETK